MIYDLKDRSTLHCTGNVGTAGAAQQRAPKKPINY